MAFARNLPDLPEPHKLRTAYDVPCLAFHFDGVCMAGWYVKLLLRATHGTLTRTQLLAKLRDSVWQRENAMTAVLTADGDIVAVIQHYVDEPRRYDLDYRYSDLLWEPIRWYHGFLTGWLFVLAGFRWRVRYL